MLVDLAGYDAVGRALAGHFALANWLLGFSRTHWVCCILLWGVGSEKRSEMRRRGFFEVMFSFKQSLFEANVSLWIPFVDGLMAVLYSSNQLGSSPKSCDFCRKVES